MAEKEKKYHLSGTNVIGRSRGEVAVKAAAIVARKAGGAAVSAGRGVVSHWLAAGQAAYGGKNPKLKWQGGIAYQPPSSPIASNLGTPVGSIEDFLGLGNPGQKKRKR